MDEITTDRMSFTNGTINVVYHNGMTSLRLHPTKGKDSTVEEYIKELSDRLMYDERIEVGDTAIHVYKTYGVEL